MKEIGVIGIGNPLRRDDGIGIILLEKLIERKDELPDGIEFIDGGTGGMNLLHLLAHFDIAIILDAVNFDGHHGESRLFRLDEIHSQKISLGISTHESDLLKVIQLSKELEECPDELFIFGIQPKDTSFGSGLSSELQHNIESLLIRLQTEIKTIFNKKIIRSLGGRES